MENQKNNKAVIVLLGVIIVILAVLCVLFATGTISFNSGNVNNEDVTNKDNNNNNDNVTNENNNNNSQNNNYVTWMNYILEQNITNISIDRSVYADDPDDEYYAKIDLTTEQLRGLFSKLMNYKLVKCYHQGSGFTYGDIITISYSVKNNNYSVEIGNGDIWISDVEDKGLLTAFENSEHTVENEEYKDTEGVFYDYYFKGYDSSILDEYFK